MPDLLLSVGEAQRITEELNNEYPNFSVIREATHVGRWTYFTRNLLYGKSSHWIDLANKVNQLFVQLEESGVKVFDPTIQETSYQEKAREYRQIREVYLNLAKTLDQKLSDIKKGSPLQKSLYELKCREVSLRYFLGRDNGGLDPLPSPTQADLADLTNRALDWKKKQKMAVTKDLNELELMQLKELSCYPEWLKIVYQNKDFLNEILGWSLRDFDSVEVAAKCHEVRRRIKENFLASNLGYVKNLNLTDKENEVLAFRTVPTKVDNISRRILTVSVYHGSFKTFEPDQQERFNFLKLKKPIHFKQGNYTVSVGEFLKEIGQKNLREANISLCADWGFVNFHPVKGVWNADEQIYLMPKMTEKDFLDHIPAARIASHEELLAQYGDKIKDRDLFFKLMSTRKNLDLNTLDCHGFWQFYSRMDDGNWKVTNLGTYAYKFPQNVIDKVWQFCNSLLMVLCLMDQNGYYTQRQRGGVPVFEDKETNESLLAKIYRLINSNGIFQFAGRNCSYYVQKITQEVMEKLPNLFLLPVIECKTGILPLDRLIAWAKHQKDWVKKLVVHILQIIFLSHRKIKDENNTDYSMRDFFREMDQRIFNPSYLLYQIVNNQKSEEGFFSEGELYWSHTDEKLYQLEAQMMKDDSSEESDEVSDDGVLIDV